MIRQPRDFHAHATAYRLGNLRPESTVMGVLDQGRELGLCMMGVVEHLNHAPKHPLECIRAMAREFHEITPPLPCFVGAEVDILDRNGKVTCSLDLKRELKLDYLLGSVHVSPLRFGTIHEYVDEELQRHLAAIRNAPQIDVIAHPWGLGAKWNSEKKSPAWSFALVPGSSQDRLIEYAARHNKAIEVNIKTSAAVADHAFADFCCKIRDAGVLIAIGSDAHALGAVSNALDVVAFLNRLDIDDSNLWHPQQ